MKKVTCHITKKQFDPYECYKADTLRQHIFDLIRKDYPDLTEDSYVSIEGLNGYRKKYLESLIQEESGELNQLEKEIIEAISSNTLLSENIEPEIESKLTPGQRVADKIAEFGGSWTFILFFFSFLFIWMGINIWVLTQRPFDPFPFILLNLILSCLAAIQAPIIMMSQNRQEQKDRIRSEHDYKVNLKAELEIRLLNEKIDHLIVHQNKRLLEIQEIQTDYLEEILKGMKATVTNTDAMKSGHTEKK